MTSLSGGQRLGVGCMRLSTEPARDEERAIAVLHAAFDAGVSFLDSADAYCRDAAKAVETAKRLMAEKMGATLA